MTVGDRAITGSGVEYIVDLYGCDPDLLRSRERLDAIMSRLIGEVGVRPIRDPLWQMFPAPGCERGSRQTMWISRPSTAEAASVRSIRDWL